MTIDCRYDGNPETIINKLQQLEGEDLQTFLDNVVKHAEKRFRNCMRQQADHLANELKELNGFNKIEDINMTDSAPILEIGEAVAATVANPSIPVIAEDLILVNKLVSDVKSQLNGKHPGLLEIFKVLFNLA